MNSYPMEQAVNAICGKAHIKTKAERVAFLFELYQKYTSLFPPEKPKRIRNDRVAPRAVRNQREN